MTATEPSVREAAAFTWKLIADYRSHCKAPDEPGFPLAVALERVTDTGCEREVAIQALCDAASARLRAAKPPKLHGRMPAVDPCVEFVGEPVLLASAEVWRTQVIEQVMAWHNLNNEQWKNRADWLEWADDARLAILWLRQIAAAELRA